VNVSAVPQAQAPSTILDVGKDCDLGRFLSRRGAHAHLLAPAAVVQTLREHAPQARWSSSQRVEDIPTSARNVFVCGIQKGTPPAPRGEGDANNLGERRLIAAVKRVRPDAKVYGVLQHVIPALVAHEQVVRMDTDPLMPLPETRYAVVCTPRTGSTLLCDRLAAAGLGLPKEHLRPPMIRVLKSRQVEHDAVYDHFLRHASAQGVFGTKLISIFLFNLSSKDDPGERLRCLAEHGFKFIRLRRNLLEQGLSRYVADASGVWHVRGDMAERTRERLSTVPYDFERMATACRNAQREALKLDQALRSAAPPERLFSLDYAHLVAQPQAALQACAQFLGVPARGKTPSATELPIKLAGSVEALQTLQTRFMADLARQPQADLQLDACL